MFLSTFLNKTLFGSDIVNTDTRKELVEATKRGFILDDDSSLDYNSKDGVIGGLMRLIARLTKDVIDLIAEYRETKRIVKVLDVEVLDIVRRLSDLEEKPKRKKVVKKTKKK